MLLVLEIVLTVLVWNKGWRWLSLIPLGIAILVGMIIGASGQTEVGAYVIFDILAVIALIVMLVKPNKPKKEVL
jgi:uncharacterized membrane protein YfcA